MIDQKVIEKLLHLDDVTILRRLPDSERTFFEYGLQRGYNRALKDLWHPYDEVPTRKDSNILQFFESYGTGTEDDFDEYFELANTREGFTQETWEEFMNEGGIPSKWLYIDNLLPKEGGKR